MIFKRLVLLPLLLPMSRRKNWLNQFNRYFFPLLVVGIGLYGVWDLIVLPFAKFERPVEVCTTTITDVAVLRPSTNPDQPPKRIQAPADLPIVVPAGEKRILSMTIENPDKKSVVHRWRATSGQFENPVSVGNESVYVAPRSLVNDTLTVEATLQGCSVAQRTLKFAIVPSTSAPLTEQALPSPSPTFPSSPDAENSTSPDGGLQ